MIPDHKEVKKNIEETVEKLKRRETIKYIIACLLFGMLSFSTNHSALGSMQNTFLRTFIGTFFLMTVFCCSTNRATLFDYTPMQLVYLVISGICIGTSWLILADSGNKLGMVSVTLTYSLGPGLLLVASPFLFKESKLTAHSIIAFLICSMGVFMIDSPFFSNPHALDVIGDVFVAAVFTVVIVFCNRKCSNINGLENAMFQMIIAFIVIAIIYVVRHGLYFEIPYPDSWWILLAGVLNTGLPVYLYLSSIDDLDPDTIAFLGYIRPITTVTISVLFFGERVNWETFVGGSLILGSVFLVDFYHRKRLKKNRTF